MITQAERAILENVNENEMDFYAGLMVLTLLRMFPERNADEIRRLVLQVYADLNERAAE